MASSGAAARQVSGAPASPRIFPDEFPDVILENIFLRLDAAADLARASAACTALLSFVRSLRRNRSLYSPLIVGFLLPGRRGLAPPHLHHVEPPHPSASAARALAQAADFTLSFLPGTDWWLHDASHGRLLVSATPYITGITGDLVVCDPLYHRYVRIPPIPIGLTTGPPSFGQFPFLTPARDEGRSFEVVWMVPRERKVTAFVFSSANGEWRAATFRDFRYNALLLTSCRNYPHQSLSRRSGSYTEVLMLDTRDMEFSALRLPRVSNRQTAIVDAGEGRLGLLTIGDGMADVDLYCKAWPVNGVDAEEWQHERAIPLPGGLDYSFNGAGDGYLLLQGSSPQQIPEVQYSIFTLKVETLQIERLCVMNERISCAHLYANFPPLLSLPSL